MNWDKEVEFFSATHKKWLPAEIICKDFRVSKNKTRHAVRVTYPHKDYINYVNPDDFKKAYWRSKPKIIRKRLIIWYYKDINSYCSSLYSVEEALPVLDQLKVVSDSIVEIIHE